MEGDFPAVDGDRSGVGRRSGASSTSRVLALVVLGASIYGVVEHVLVNLGSGALDQRFANSWDGLSLLQRLWLAATKIVGPAPPLAPGVLGQTALLLLLATVAARPAAVGTADRR